MTDVRDPAERSESRSPREPGRRSPRPSGGLGPRRRALLLLGVLGLLAGCGERLDPDDRADRASQEGLSHPMVGRPAPEFVGDSLTPGGWLPLGGLRMTPIAILFFQPGGPFAAELVREFDRFRNDRSMAPTRFMGVVRDTPEAIERFQRVYHTDLPILRDPGSITRDYGIGATPTIVLLDVDHIVRFRLDGFVGAEFRPRLAATAAALRELPQLRVHGGRTVRLEYGRYERLPDLTVAPMNGGVFHLAETRGRALVLLFLDSPCSWCGVRLGAIMKSIAARDDHALSGVAILIDPPDETIARRLAADYPRLRVLLDGQQATLLRFAELDAPELLLVDEEGFIHYRAPRDLDEDEFMAEFRLQLGDLLGEAPPPSNPASPVAPVGSRVAHVGQQACRECHEAEYLQWRATPHAAAITRLIHENRAGDTSCTPCHTTGSGLVAGFGDPLATASMTNVQCEACHGPGFDHVNVPPELKRQTIYGLSRECRGCDIATFCTGCHDAENDPGFDLATALPRVTH